MFDVLMILISRSKSNGLFARITMGFIVNLALAFMAFMQEHLKGENDIGTDLCKAKGYFALYFFLVRKCIQLLSVRLLNYF